MPGFDKLSKSDMPDWSKDEGSLGQLHRLLTNKSKHFDVGTDIHLRYQRGTILARFKDSLGNGLLIAWPDGSITTKYPIALN